MCQLTTPSPRKRIAVVGGGISGLACAYLLHRQAANADVDVVLFEASDIAGGHALTVDIELLQRRSGSDAETRVPVAVDVGFQVFNLTTYPHLVGFFDALGVTSRPSDMSFGCSMPLSTDSSSDIFEWSSTRNLQTIFPTYSAMLDSRRYDLLKDVLRFQKEAPLFLEEVDRGLYTDLTVSGFLAMYKYSETFRDVYMLPMIAAIWSMPKRDAMGMPMRTLIRFMVNHHLHKVHNRPKWRTVVDRSRQYVNRVVAALPQVRLNAPIVSVTTVDGPDGTTMVQVQQANGETELFDDVVLATHTDVSLAMLGDAATPDERAVLEPITYQPNRCVLHTDASIMPADRALWASWNVKEFPHDTESSAAPVCCSYWVNLLQNLDEGMQDVFVTLNPPHALANTLMEFELSHPALTRAAVDAQEKLPTIQGNRHIYFAGAWTRYGFHEDGILSAVHVAQLVGQAYNANAHENPKTHAALALPWTPRSPSPTPPSRLARVCLGLFDTYAAKSVTVGTLKLLLPDGSERVYKGGGSGGIVDKHAVVSKSLHQYHGIDLSGITIQLQIHDLAMFPRVVFGHSSIAMAEAYMDHLFDISLEDSVTRRRLAIPQYAATENVQADDRLAVFLYWCALNLNTIESNTNLLGGPAQWAGRHLKAFYHWQRQFNTIAQAKKHISMHYDLGNDLYELFLDRSMTYSSGMLPIGIQSDAESETLKQLSRKLEQDQDRKLEHAFLAAQIGDGDRVLEIGCGWGSMAIYACTHAQCQWTALTLSSEQKAMMEKRVAAAGLSDRIEVLLTDFRELAQMPSFQGVFDRIVSLEMIEALGDGNLPGYFADINRFLKAETGRVLIQAITIPDDRYAQYCKNTDFIKEFIFPGGHLPSRARMYGAVEEGNAISKVTTHRSLRLTEEVEFGTAYASTLRAWRLRMLRNRPAILALTNEAAEPKYDARFLRMFEWYFAYCEVGFQQGLIHVVQVVLENKTVGVTSTLPLLPATLRAGRNEKIRTTPFTRFESHILTGSVFHARHDGYKNAFQYDTVMALLNLDDLYTSKLFTSRSYLSLNHPNLLAFHRADHFGDPKRTLKSSVVQLIQDACAGDAATLEEQVGTVFLLTTIRCLGYCFNPISIYYCMALENPSQCLYVVLEVTNTPWLEKQCYVLRANTSVEKGDELMDVRFVKELHVSPFFNMDCEYRLRLNHPGMLMTKPTTALRVLLDLHERQPRGEEGEEEPESESALGKKLFTATVNLTSLAHQVQTIETTQGKTAAAKHEFFVLCAMAIMAWQAQLYIHWQAIKLAINGQPIIRAKHPAYKGRLRATAMYLADLGKHLSIFAVALVGLGVIKVLKYATEKPVVGAAGAAATALAAMMFL